MKDLYITPPKSILWGSKGPGPLREGFHWRTPESLIKVPALPASQSCGSLGRGVQQAGGLQSWQEYGSWLLRTARLPLNLGNIEEHIWPFSDPLGLSWFFLARLDSQSAKQQPETWRLWWPGLRSLRDEGHQVSHLGKQGCYARRRVWMEGCVDNERDQAWGPSPHSRVPESVCSPGYFQLLWNQETGPWGKVKSVFTWNGPPDFQVTGHHKHKFTFTHMSLGSHFSFMEDNPWVHAKLTQPHGGQRAHTHVQRAVWSAAPTENL